MTADKFECARSTKCTVKGVLRGKSPPQSFAGVQLTYFVEAEAVQPVAAGAVGQREMTMQAAL